MRTRRSRDSEDDVLCYMRGKSGSRNVSKRGTACTSVCGTTSACTKAWLRIRRAESLSELFVVTKKRSCFLVWKERFLGRTHEKKKKRRNWTTREGRECRKRISSEEKDLTECSEYKE